MPAFVVTNVTINRPIIKSIINYDPYWLACFTSAECSFLINFVVCCFCFCLCPMAHSLCPRGHRPEGAEGCCFFKLKLN